MQIRIAQKLTFKKLLCEQSGACHFPHIEMAGTWMTAAEQRYHTRNTKVSDIHFQLKARYVICSRVPLVKMCPLIPYCVVFLKTSL